MSHQLTLKFAILLSFGFLGCRNEVKVQPRQAPKQNSEGLTKVTGSVSGYANYVFGLNQSSKEVAIGNAGLKFYCVQDNSESPSLLGSATADDKGQYTQFIDQSGCDALFIIARDSSEVVGQTLVLLKPTNNAASLQGTKQSGDINIASSISASLMMGFASKISAVEPTLWQTFVTKIQESIASTVHPGDLASAIATVSKSAEVQALIRSLLGSNFTTKTSSLEGLKNLGAVVAGPTSGTATLIAVSVQADATSVPKGGVATLAAVGIYDDGNVENISSKVTWKVSNSQMLVLSSANEVTVTGGTPGVSSVTASFGSVVGSLSITTTAATLKTLAITAITTTPSQYTTTQLTATGTYTDSTTQDLTSSVNWYSSNTSLATVDNSGTKGLVNAIDAGVVTVSVTKDGVSASLSLSISAAALSAVQISSPTVSIAKGLTSAFTATGVFVGSTTQDITSSATWASSDTAVATVTNGGVVTGVGVGTATISATLNGISGSAAVTVTTAVITELQVTTTAGALPNGMTRDYAATAIFTDNTNQDVTSLATWSSSATHIATVSNAGGTEGRVVAVAIGSTSIMASYNGVSTQSNLTVSAATLSSIAVTPSAASIILGTPRQYSAVGTYSDGTTQDITSSVTWASTNTANATISNAGGTKGLATPIAAGSATINATSGAVVGSTTANVVVVSLQSISVTVDNASIPLGLAQQYTAVGTYSNGSTQDLTSSVVWSSADAAIISVSNANGSNGLGSSLTTGTTTITATIGSVSGSIGGTITPAELASISVTPANASVAAGYTQQYVATGTYTDSSTLDISNQVTWTSSLTSKATISNVDGSRGLAATLAAGSSTITAASGAISRSAALTVTAAVLTSIAVTPSTPTIANGLTRQFTAAGTYTDASTEDLSESVIWASSNTSVATISTTSGTKGLATAVAVGTSTISATAGATSSSTTLTVGAPSLVSVAISPQISSATYGDTKQFALTGTYSDGSTQTLTSSATWSSSNTSMATINSNGLASPTGIGSTTISATVSGISDSTSLTVSGQAAPSDPTNLTATIDSDNQVSLTWTSSGGTTSSFKIAYALGSTAPSTCSSGTQVTSSTAGKTITSLTAGAQYAFRVCAVNSNPAPDISSGVTTTATTTHTAPPDVSGLQATVNSAAQITLNWTSGGGSTSSYKVAYQSGATAPANCSSGTTTTSSTAAKVLTGLNASTQYAFRVCSVDNVSTPYTSTGVTVTATTEAPAVLEEPTGLGATVDSSSQITLAWTSGGGSTASYKVAYQSGATAPATCSTGTTVASATASKEISSLSPNTQYSFRVCSVDVASIESTGITVSATTGASAGTPPDPTDLVRVTATTTTGVISLAWTAGVGAATPSYRVAYLAGTTAPNANCSNGSTTTASTTSKLVAVSPGGTYSFRVCAVDSTGTDLSPGITLTTQTTPPSLALTATVNSATTVTLSWTPSGGSTVGYKIAYQTGSYPATCDAGTTLTTTATSVQLTGLNSSVLHYFKVCAYNSLATPDLSAPGATSATPSGVVTIVDENDTTGSYAAANNSTTITLVGTWTTNAITGRGFGSDLIWASPTTNPAGTASATYVFTGLTAGVSYRVSATWFESSNRASNSKFTVSTSGTGGSASTVATVNQKLAPSSFTANGKAWKDLSSSFTIGSGGTLSIELNNYANGYVVADAIRIEEL